jgi:DNA-binding MarR family transcriptional regulator
MIENESSFAEHQLPALPPVPTGGRHDLVQKWQGGIRHNAGFVAVPVVLLRGQARLGLTAAELNVLLNLMGYWWNLNTPVFPRTNVIAKRMGVTSRTVQRAIESLLKKKLITRERAKDGKRVLYLHPLVEKVAAIADTVLWEKEVESSDV